MSETTQLGPRTRTVPLPGRGGEIALLDFGPPDRPVDVIFSHANGFNARTYRSILAPLGEDLRILALDLRGHGASSLSTGVEGWPGWYGFRDDLLVLLDAEVEGPVVLAGHSVGGATSLFAAAMRPDCARALVMFEPVLLSAGTRTQPDWDFPPAKAALRRRRSFPSRAQALAAYRGRGAFATWSEVQLADYVEAGFHDMPDGQVTLACTPEWEALTFAFYNADPQAALAELQTPTTVLFGEIESAAQLAPAGLETHPLVTVETLAGASHFLPMERPQAAQAAIRAAAAHP